MEWNEKIIEKHEKKENSALDEQSLGIVKKIKHVMLLKNIRANMFGPVDYQTRRPTQVALLDAEHRKAEALTLIRRVTFI